MEAEPLPLPPRTGTRRTLHRSSSQESINNAISKVRAAVVKLNDFLAEGNSSQDGLGQDDNSISSELRHLRDSEEALGRELQDVPEDAGSIATELRHLHDAEEEVRHELEGISPESRVESLGLIEVPPATKSSIRADVAESQPEENGRIKKRDSFGLKRQISEGSFRQLQDALETIFQSFERDGDHVDLETVERKTPLHSNKTNFAYQRDLMKDDEADASQDSVLERLASVAFGRRKYKIRPALTLSQGEQRFRTVQGGVCVVMATAIVISMLYRDSGLFPIFLALVPPIAVWFEVNLPHRIEETTIALCILAAHFMICQVHPYSAQA